MNLFSNKTKSVLRIGASIIALALAANCGRNATDDSSGLLANGVAVGEIRGTALINKTVRTRMLDQNVASTFTFEIERVAGNEIFGMRGLLGQFAEGAAQTEYRGGEPNPFGLLLWHQIWARFGEALASSCGVATPESVQFALANTTVTLKPSFAAALTAACAFEGDVQAKTQTATKIWRAFVGLGALTEEAAFAELFAGAESPFATANPRERIEAMVLAMAMSPHFLLEK